ncbi:DNA polymerase III subunit beta [Fulvimarina sp. 2208YS6-2-32]|uniref:Beta sliding clamp n=1 Tax=Fulvimarina uroteuthidis TaxID=3098149 RepID=A0ABU5HYU2_9HYPH|nr:DNA polymerase III subunit beta [Fulvimarina sp. 2208YS6-2-32]MDY8108284.1 DNA polymerase III subunit beta [Fulvimarina sp. 2208YS6-2-32]
MFDFTIPRADFLAAVERVEKIAPPKATIPVLSHVLIDLAEDGTLHVTATDLQRRGIATSRAETQEGHGATCVLCANLATTLKRQIGDVVTVSVGEREAVIKCGRSKVKMPTLPAHDFPDIRKEAVGGSAMRMTGPELDRMISACAFAMSKDQSRFQLRGVFWTAEGDKLTAVGTDGSKLATISMPMPEGTHDVPASILPDTLVLALAPFTKAQVVDVTIGDGFAEFVADGFSLTSRLVDASYPDFRRVIPAEGSFKVRTDREALIASIRRVETFAGGGEREIALVFTPDNLRLVAASSSTGEAEDEIEVDGNASLTIGFKSEVLVSSLSSLDCTEIEIALNDQSAPAVLFDPEDDSRLVVVMPYRLGSATMQAVNSGAVQMKEAA